MDYGRGWEKMKGNNMQLGLAIQKKLMAELKENKLLETSDLCTVARAMATVTLTILQGERANQLGMKITELEAKLSELEGRDQAMADLIANNPNQEEKDNGNTF